MINNISEISHIQDVIWIVCFNLLKKIVFIMRLKTEDTCIVSLLVPIFIY